MSILQRQIVWAASFAFLLALVFSAAYIIVFPLERWSDLWNRHLMDIPFVIFIPVISVSIGILFGAVSGLYWKKQLHLLDQSLFQLEEGGTPS